MRTRGTAMSTPGWTAIAAPAHATNGRAVHRRSRQEQDRFRMVDDLRPVVPQEEIVRCHPTLPPHRDGGKRPKPDGAPRPRRTGHEGGTVPRRRDKCSSGKASRDERCPFAPREAGRGDAVAARLPRCYRAGAGGGRMRATRCLVTAALAALPLAGVAAAGGGEGEGLQITVYNQDFALVRQARSLHLREGENEVRIGGVTALLEPESVVLRDRQDPKGLRILGQRYAGGALSQGFLLHQSEGKVLAFQTVNPGTGKREIVSGRVIRSGYAPQGSAAPGGASPIVEVDGKMQFSLPGEPLFDAPGPDAIYEPLLLWTLWSGRA